jgi:hypothetical protein
VHKRLVTRYFVMGQDESIVDGPYEHRKDAVTAMWQEAGYRRWPFWYSIRVHRYTLDTVDGEFMGVPSLSGWQLENRLRKEEYEHARRDEK